MEENRLIQKEPRDPGFRVLGSLAIWTHLWWWTHAEETGKLRPQKRATDGRDSCLDSAGQLVRKGLSDVQAATKALVGKGVPR